LHRGHVWCSRSQGSPHSLWNSCLQLRTRSTSPRQRGKKDVED
jgi:hypothetical protein